MPDWERAGKGAATGAAIGSVGGPIGAALGGVIGGTAGLLNIGRNGPGKLYKDDLRARWDAYQNALQTGDLDVLGVPWEVQQQNIANAQQQASAQQQAAATELARSALAGNQVQSGALQEAAQGVTDQGQAALATASAQQSDLSQKLIEQRIAQLRTDLLGQRNHNEELLQKYLEAGLEGYKALSDGTDSAFSGATS